MRLASGALCPAPVPEDCTAGSEVQLSVRPEKIWLDEHEEGMVRLTGTVAERVYVGTTTQVIVELGPETRIVALEQNTHVSDRRRPLGDRPPGHAGVAAGALARAALSDAPAVATTTSAMLAQSRAARSWPSTTKPASAATAGSSDISTPNTRRGRRRSASSSSE